MFPHIKRPSPAVTVAAIAFATAIFGALTLAHDVLLPQHYDLLSLPFGERMLLLVAVALMVVGGMILFRHHIEQKARKKLERHYAQVNAALNNMSHGLTMFDSELRLVFCNDRYLEMCGLERKQVPPGIPIANVLALRKKVGSFNGDPKQYLTFIGGTAGPKTTTHHITLTPDGRSIMASLRPLPEGGWIATHEDITETRRMREEIDTSASFLQSVIDNIPTCVAVRDAANGRYKLVNRAFERLNGVERGKIVGMTARDIYQDDTLSATLSLDRQALASEQGIAEEERRVNIGGRLRHVSNKRIVIADSDSKPKFLLSIFEDITARTELAEELKNTKRFLETVVDNIPVSVIVKRISDDRYVLVNREAEEILGAPRQLVVGKTVSECFPAAHAKVLNERDRVAIEKKGEVYSGVYPLDHPTRGMRMYAGRRVAVMNKDGDAEYVILTQEDITERRQNETKIVHMAFHDALTRLPNRAAFSQSLAQMIDACGADGGEFAVLSVDLDRFKEINDVFGHAFGDKLLTEIAKAIQIASEGAAVARLSGDEFGLIIDGPQPETGRALAERLANAMRDEFLIDGNALRVGLTCGISVYPRDGTDPAALLANADAALYRAKAEARGSIRVFEPEMDQQTRDRRALHLDLSAAVQSRQLSLYFQPLVRASEGHEIVGFETLVRWHHPMRGFVSPAVFIPIAEESSLIVEMGEWILRQACREASSWPKPIQVAVNLSPVQFLHGDLAGLVHSILLETGLAPSRLELEITEGVLIRDFDRGLGILRRLKALGVKIAFDDFGTGYSSLSYLQSFPFDKIKIDRTFVMNIGRNAQSTAIIRSIIGLGHGLNVPIVAEGVETEEQRDFLAAAQCDQLQGFLLGRPAPIHDYALQVGRERPVEQPPHILRVS